MPRANYPRTVAEVLDVNRKYKPDVLRAVRTFRRSRPWRGTVAERREKLAALHRTLCAAYGLTVALRFCHGPDCFIPATSEIRLSKPSVVTYLHEFAHAAFGSCERTACGWSINLFRRVFPRSFARCRQAGHMLYRE